MRGMSKKPSYDDIAMERGECITFLKRRDAIEYKDAIKTLLNATFSGRFEYLKDKAKNITRHLHRYKFEIVTCSSLEGYRLQWFECEPLALGKIEGGTEQRWAECDDSKTVGCLNQIIELIKRIASSDAVVSFALGNPDRQGAT